MGLINSLKEYFGYTPSDDNGINGKFEMKEGATGSLQPTAFAEKQKLEGTEKPATTPPPLDTATLSTNPAATVTPPAAFEPPSAATATPTMTTSEPAAQQPLRPAAAASTPPATTPSPAVSAGDKPAATPKPPVTIQ